MLTGAQIALESLIREGVDTIFGYPGGANLWLYRYLPTTRRSTTSWCATSRAARMPPTATRAASAGRWAWSLRPAAPER